MVELEIIIPAYNAHSTIETTLDSLASQKDNNIFHVTIVNDCGKSYKNIIKKYHDKLKITEIKTLKNVGPGQTRQYGIDNTNSNYILFIDADDYLYSPESINLLLSQIKTNNADLLISNFIYERDNKKEIKKNDVIWLHGKIYKRKFLEDNKIRFNSTRTNEDNGFNRLIILLSPKIVYLNEITYVYHDNNNSITRKDNRLYRFTGLEGYAYNMNWAMEEAIKRNALDLGIAITSIAALCSMYYYYLELYNIYDVEKIIKWSKPIYLMYKKYEAIATQYETKILENLKNDYRDKNIKMIITFKEFLKKVRNYDD